MRKSAVLLLPLLLVLVLGAAGCGKGGSSSSGGNGTVQMSTDNFITKDVTIPAGSTVTFVDPPAGATHLLCLGKNQSCDDSIKDGPPELSGGKTLEIDSGQKSVTFPTKGDYPVTCTVHQNMDMVVHVQ